MRRVTHILLVLAGLCLAAALAPPVTRAVPYGVFNRPQDEWKVAETKFFRFYFTDETPRTTAYLMEIADETFERLNRFYGYQPPDKITVTIVGYTSYSNGFADSTRNRITIFPTPPSFTNRSRVPWLRNVFTHELSHIISLNTANHWLSRVPVVLGTGVVRTQDAQGLLRMPVYGRSHPHWFVEGVAQFDTELLERDAFDENRAAVQRAAWEDGMFFPLGKLAFFGGEKWYNTGFAFLKYLEERFGDGTTHRLFRHAGSTYYYVFDSLFEDVLGVPLDQLEADFRADVKKRFEAHRGAQSEGLYDGKPIRFEGQEQDYRELTAGQRDDLRNDFRASPSRVIDGRLYYRMGGVIMHASFDPEDRTLGAPEAIAEGGAFARHVGDSYFVLRSVDTDPSIVPYWYRPEYEAASLVLVHSLPPAPEKEKKDEDQDGDQDGDQDSDDDADEEADEALAEEREEAAEALPDEKVLLHETSIMDFDVCPSRAEMATVHNDGDGNLELVFYPIEGWGTDDVAIRTDRGRHPLDKRDFDEVRHPRYAPGCEKLFFSRQEGNDHDIFYWDFRLDRAVPFATEDGFELYPEPAEDGVYYVSARSGTMQIYHRAYGGRASTQVTRAITAHHRPVHGAGGLFFSRLYGTGFQIHHQRDDWRPDGPPVELIPKQPEAGQGAFMAFERPTGDDYSPWSTDNILAPSFVPMLDVQLDTERSFGDPLRTQAGVEVYVEDQLREHSLLLRALAGNRTTLWTNYRNMMSPVTLQLRFGMTDIRSLYTFVDEEDGESFDHVTDYGWGFLYGVASLPLNLFHSVSLSAETILDVGTTIGARDRPYTVANPRFARDLIGSALVYSGLDRSDPTFRERDINKRGYREYRLNLSLARERVHPLLVRDNDDITDTVTPYVRAQFHHTEYMALPDLMNGWFDHTLQLDVDLGYISDDIRFLPFFGGGRLYSLTSPELNTSVGFVGYGSFALAGETLLNLGVTYRFPLARRIEWDWGPLYLEDIYAQIFTSWGNIWGFDEDGGRQVPFADRASNGRHVVGDVGFDLRLLNFFQELETNVGTTLRVAYRLVPLTECEGEDVREDPGCLDGNGDHGPIYYLIVGGGF
ncbi:MAG: hypothetical protein OXT09_22050 [Myxococcales bacterium]|nr:hypothetical protein [Myxococcales bacterium]